MIAQRLPLVYASIPCPSGQSKRVGQALGLTNARRQAQGLAYVAARLRDGSGWKAVVPSWEFLNGNRGAMIEPPVKSPGAKWVRGGLGDCGWRRNAAWPRRLHGEDYAAGGVRDRRIPGMESPGFTGGCLIVIECWLLDPPKRGLSPQAACLRGVEGRGLGRGYTLEGWPAALLPRRSARRAVRRRPVVRPGSAC